MGSNIIADLQLAQQIASDLPAIETAFANLQPDAAKAFQHAKNIQAALVTIGQEIAAIEAIAGPDAEAVLKLVSTFKK